MDKKLIEAVESRDVWAVYALLNSGANVNAIDTRNDRKESALHLATARGYHEICKILLERGADVEITDHCGNNPLHVATMNNDIAVAMVLMNHGARPEYVNDADYSAWNMAPSQEMVRLFEGFEKINSVKFITIKVNGNRVVLDQIKEFMNDKRIRDHVEVNYL